MPESRARTIAGASSAANSRTAPESMTSYLPSIGVLLATDRASSKASQVLHALGTAAQETDALLRPESLDQPGYTLLSLEFADHLDG